MCPILFWPHSITTQQTRSQTIKEEIKRAISRWGHLSNRSQWAGCCYSDMQQGFIIVMLCCFAADNLMRAGPTTSTPIKTSSDLPPLWMDASKRHKYSQSSYTFMTHVSIIHMICIWFDSSHSQEGMPESRDQHHDRIVRHPKHNTQHAPHHSHGMHGNILPRIWHSTTKVFLSISSWYM